MLQFIIRRTVGAAVTLFLIGAATFFLFVAGPSDYASLACGKDCSAARLEEIREVLGLNQPVAQQFWDFMSGIVMGRDFPTGHCSAPCLGQSFYSGDLVWDTIMDRFPLTVSLTIGAALVFLIVGLGTGMLAAFRRGSHVDKVATGASMVLSSFQIYFLGPIALMVLVYGTGLMEDPKYVPFTEDPFGWLIGLSIPMVVMATIFTAQYTRMARSSLIEQLAEDHVRTARAKGMSQKYVFFRYAWRGSLIPIVTILGIDLSSLLGGAVVTELTFSLQGIGRLAVDGAVNKDLPLTMGVMLVGAFMILVLNILVDIAYAWIDPRVRLS
ncbi:MULTISPECIES: ABC transporter permease [Streptomyces]|jgi:peptide/nickel transport system permease protein|uniref:ABC transporter permease n=3 Tax=Streptomyces rochei group TaxID=2867164 RepID=A0AAX3ZNB9_STRRO|nr:MULTISPECIES: ABC transporter permease [Streptomyces]MBD2817624.1 ABC transporter permease [Streptomyces parvulus]RIH60779.1 ABC transporter permease [Streptomyces sp. SHP22-7]WDI20413.1 ABC transporter permease [Streptomyces enissocaesilis]MBJ6621305.1 ABC transporter permease [Streptomyces sp. DHE17-7]MBQ0880036.1 ABC transporter permease [Streptomyces sp. RT42]